MTGFFIVHKQFSEHNATPSQQKTAIGKDTRPIPRYRSKNVSPGVLAERTLYAASTFVQNMRINFGGVDVCMAEQFLNRPQIIAPFEQTSCEAMAKGVAGYRFINVCRQPRLFDTSPYP